MSKFYAWLLSLLITSLTSMLSRWRRLTVLARLHDRLAPTITTTANGTPITFFTPDRTSIYWPRHGMTSEPNTLDWIDGFADEDVLYDIGANVGAYSVYAAKRKRMRVIAIEPNPFSFHALARNLLLNDVLERVTPLCLTLGAQSEPGVLSLSSIESGSVGNTLLAAEARPTDGSFSLRTQVCRLDTVIEELGQPPPNHIKIDVDGIEIEILKGAQATLKDSRLRSVLVEFETHDQTGRERIQALFDDCDLAPASDWREDGSGNRLYVRKGET